MGLLAKLSRAGEPGLEKRDLRQAGLPLQG